MNKKMLINIIMVTTSALFLFCLLENKKNETQKVEVIEVATLEVQGAVEATIEMLSQEFPSEPTTELLYSEPYAVCDYPLTATMGVKWFEGHRETWYSQKVLPGPGLNIPGRHVADDGTVRDAEGYIVIACDLSYAARGSIILTSLGPGKVYDTGCAYGTLDIYVDW